MRILQLHNRYLTGLGGEDTVVQQEFQMLTSAGHSVYQLFVETLPADVSGTKSRIKTAVNSIWSRSSNRLVAKAILRLQPDVLHAHNTFPILSPSVYSASKRLGVPTVCTLHNYRLVCSNALLMRENHVCEDCVGRAPWPALRHRCYRGSLAATLPLVATQLVHKAAGTYEENVDCIIALTTFAKELFIRAGYSADKIVVKPNFIADPLDGRQPLKERENKVVYVGKLVKEKGVDDLIQAWKLFRTDCRLIIIGDGPEFANLKSLAAGQENIVWLGQQPREELLQHVATSKYLVMSSRWYEGLPMVLLEALAVGTPAIVPNLGSMPEIVGNGRAGMMFQPGDIASLAAVIQNALANNWEWDTLSHNARSEYLSHYTPENNYSRLLAIYDSVISHDKLQ